MKRKPLVSWFPFRFALLIAPLMAAWPQPVRAADLWWDNAGGTANDWGSLANWSTVVDGGTNPGALPAAGDLAKFSATPIIGAAQTVNVNANRSVLGLDFLSTLTAATTLQGGGTNRTLTLAGSGIVKAGTGAVTIGSGTAGQQVAFLLSADQTWANSNNTGVLTIQNTVGASTATARKLTLGGTSTAANIINGVIANNGAGIFSLDKTGAGLWALAGANTFTGAVNVTGGTLRIQNAAGLGAGTAVSVTTSTLDIRNTITVAAGKTLTMNSNATGDERSTLLSGANNNSWNSSIVAAGTGLVQVNATGGTLTIGGGVTSTGGGGTGTLFTRGTGTVVYNGTINLGADRIFTKTDSGTVIVNSTGNSWVRTQAADGQIQIGINNALDAGKEFTFGQGSATNGRLELNGFSQAVPRLNSFATSTGTNHILRNSNFTTASTLTFATPGATTDILKNVQVQGTASGLGTLNLVSNGAGRTEFENGLVAANSWTVNSGTLAFTGTNNRALSGNVSGLAAGTIEKAGATSLSATGMWNHAGPTNITGGLLALGSGTAGAINVSDNASLATGLGGGVLTSTAVTFGTAGATIYAPVLTNAAVAPLTTTALTNAGTTVTIAPLAASFTPGTTYRLLDYTSVSGLGGFTLGPAGSYPHITAALDTTVVGQINLVVGAVDSVIWTGQSSNTWDINTTTNFALASGPSTAAAFYQGDAVVFGDTHDVGAPGTPVTNRTITGGALGTGNLTFTNTAGIDYSIAPPLTVAGNILKSGAGAVTLSGDNRVNGTVSITDGVLKLGHANALAGNAGVTVAAGATFDANGILPIVKYGSLSVSGTGLGGIGAIVNNGAGITNSNHFNTITLAGNTTWGGSGRYDVTAGTSFNGGAFTLTKIGAGELWFNPAAGSTLENVIVNAGNFGSQQPNPLSTTATVTVNTGALHSLFNANSQHPVTVNNGGTFQSTNGTSVSNGIITLNGAGVDHNLGGSNTFNTAAKITGDGGFTKVGAGAMNLLSNANDFTGDVRVLLGNLNMSPTGTIPVATNLFVDGGVFDLWDRNHTVASISGTGGTILTGGTALWKLTTTQSTATEANTTVTRAVIEMSGMGSLTLGGTADNNSASAIVNSGTLILAKGNTAAVAQAIHAVATGNLNINGGTAQLAGSYDNVTTPGTVVNLAPVGYNTGTYVDQIYNAVAVVLNAGIFDLNGRQEAINTLVNPAGAGGTVTNTAAATAAKLFVGHQNGASLFGGAINDGAGTVAIEKIGTGALTLSGTSNFTGGLTQTAGSIIVPAAAVLGNTPITVAANSFTFDGTHGTGAIALNGTSTFAGAGTSGGTLTAATGTTVLVGTATGGTGAATLSLGGLALSGGANLNLDFNATGTTMDKIVTTVSNAVTLNGANNVNVALGASGWVTGTYPIISYAGAVVGTGSAALTLTTPQGHSTVTITDAAGSINLMVNGAGNNKWVGSAGSAWDIATTANWSLSGNSFLNGDTAYFDNTATTFTPAIAANVTPVSVVFDNLAANPYTLTGTATAGITGTGGITKTNDGTVTMATMQNTYTGATVVNQGTLIANVNAGTATTTIPAASLVNVDPGATLKVVANDANIAFNNRLSGSGTIVIDPHFTGATAVREVNINSTGTTFTGKILLSPSAGAGTDFGTFRTNAILTPAGIGAATIEVDAGAQAWVNASTFTNNFIIIGHGFSETAGGTPIADSGLTAYTGATFGGIGAIRMENNAVISGNITLEGPAKIMSYGATGTLSGSISTTNASDTLVIGGGGSGTNILLTGTNNAGANPLRGIFVNSGTATAQGQLVAVGNNTTTGTLGTGSVTLNGDGGSASIRFERIDGYTLAAGNTINSIGTNTANTQVRLDSIGGFNQNAVAINLALGSVLTGTVAGRVNSVANLNGDVTAGAVRLGTAATGSTLNILPGANIVNSGNFWLGEAANLGASVVQTGGASTAGTHVRIGHWPTETSNYSISAGSLVVTSNPALATDPSGGVEQNGGIYVGIDGTGTMAQSGGTVTTDWIVLDNRGNTAAGTNMPDGIDRYTLTNGTLILRSQWGITQRNATTAVTLGGGTIRNGGTSLEVRLDTAPDISGAVTLDTVSAGNSFNLTRNASGAGSLALSGGGKLKFTTALTQSIAVPITGTGALEKLGIGTTTLSAANTYSGDTTVSAGGLTLTTAPSPLNANSGNDASTVTIAATGATLTLSYTGTDKVGKLFTGATERAAGVYGHTDSGATNGGLGVGALDAYFGPGTGTLTVVSGTTYASWINGFFPGETDPLIIGAAADPDRDGIPNGVEMVIGSNPALGMDTALLPTMELVTNPVSLPAIPAGDYLLFTYRRTDLSVSSGVASDCETSSDPIAPWTAATGAPGVVIQVDDDFTFTPPAAATDRVRVYVPRGVNPEIFGRLKVTVP